MRAVGLCFLAVVSTATLRAQATGAVAGRVHDATSGLSLSGVTVTVDGGRQGASSDTSGAYRVREVRAGWHRVQVSRIGYRMVIYDSVLVRGGETIKLDVALNPVAVQIESLVVTAPDRVLDPMVPQDMQRITAEQLRRLPVSSVQEAIGLAAGTVGQSYRGGRLGQQSFVLDGLGVKNPIDASTGDLGLQIPTDMLTEASLTTNAFSARYGQAISGVVNVITKDGGDEWNGRAAYETDRPMPDGWDYGLDRVIVSGDGPLTSGIRFAGVLDVQGRLDADPANAPPPTDSLDPRFSEPWVLPHNSGERYDLTGKLTIPLGARQTLRLFGLRSAEQRLLFDAAYKYDPAYAPAQQLGGTLLTAYLQHTASPDAVNPLTLDLRLAYFDRDYTRGALTTTPSYQFGAFTLSSFHFLGEDLARSQDTVAARAPVAGFTPPDYSHNTPWGVPGFFLGGAPRGEIAWNHLKQLRTQLDMTLGGGPHADFYFGGDFTTQHVQTFQRVFAYLPTTDSGVPPPTASNFTPVTAAAYAETQLRFSDLAFTVGLRYDQFAPGALTPDAQQRYPAKRSLNPRLAVSTVLQGATFVASWGRFSQAPDFQYLTDAAFDDTMRTGRFRIGNPDLGFETATQYEFSLRLRPTPITAVRGNLYVKRLDGLVASVPLGVNPDSTVFGNTDYGTVKGLELIFDRDLVDGWGLHISYTLQTAVATATNAYQFFHRVFIDSLGDTVVPARVEYPLDYDRRHGLTVILQGKVSDIGGPRIAGHHPFAGLEGSAVFRFASGLPYTRTTPSGDTLIGLPNSNRLPSTHSLDFLVLLPIRVVGRTAGVYLDVRNALNTQNIESVRRDTGQPQQTTDGIEASAQAAYQANPNPIPYESQRYRRWADLDGNGLIEGPGELLPLYRAAAADFSQPIFYYGPPRLIRLGVQLTF
ncbi:MAG TPA: TonB-dependent receptor [Gemmatimonadales bacterium]|nr:TonB-dependent receptor [Gemmatimonadales bacterium]